MMSKWLQPSQLRLATSTILSLTLLTACDPREKYKQVIEDEGFIPYMRPVDKMGAGAGVLQYQVAEKPEKIVGVAQREDCFGNLNLWRDSEVDLANRVNRFSVGFDAAANSILVAGNTTVSFNIGAKFVKSVEIKFEGAKIEEVDLFDLEDYYPTMSERCKRTLDSVPFVYKTLKISAMEFSFKNQSGGNITLNAKVLKDIVDIKAGVNWEYVNDYTISVKTPKYIGYQMARFKKGDRSGQIEKLAWTTERRGYWDFIKIDPAELLPAFLSGLTPRD